MKEEYKNYNYKINLTYEDLLNIKASMTYSGKRIPESEQKEIHKLIILHDKIEKQMLEIIDKKRSQLTQKKKVKK